MNLLVWGRGILSFNKAVQSQKSIGLYHVTYDTEIAISNRHWISEVETVDDHVEKIRDCIFCSSNRT